MGGGGVRIEVMITSQTKGRRDNGTMRGGGAGRWEAVA